MALVADGAMRTLPIGARVLVCAVIAAAAAVILASLWITIPDPLLFAGMLTLSSLTAVLKVRLPLPGQASTMSVSYAVDFASLLFLGTSQTLLISAVSAWSQCTFRISAPNPPHRTLFSMGTLVLTAWAAGTVFTALGGHPGELHSWVDIAPVAAAATTYFLVNTGLVAAAIALSSGSSIVKIWNANFLWSAPGYFVGGAVAAGVILLLQSSSEWWTVIVIVPLYLTYRTYTVYLGRIRDEQQHVKQMADLHLATLEALAIAIDAKDQTHHSHTRRVQLYASALAREAGMSDHDIQGVRTAALLHDIGKLAIPEHILSKPGSLTPEELHKVRSHPKIGADIISAVPFPYPVAPLIQCHHERWDGKGYPNGLKGEQIPLGARVLTVVDYFDSVMADRPYHKAVPFESAVALITLEAGKALDPTLVGAFVKLLPQLQPEAARLAAIEPSAAAAVTAPAEAPRENVLGDIALAHREIYALYEISQAMSKSLGVADAMALIADKLTSLVPFSCTALFLHDEATDTLRCRFATGINGEVIQQIAVRSGEGVIGTAARERRSVVNGRPADDLSAAGLTLLSTELQSALVTPLLSGDGIIGAIAVYHVDPEFYTEDHRRLLDRVSEQAAATVRNAMLFEQTQRQSRTDALTGLPNVRALHEHVARELARAERLKAEVALLLIDVDHFKEINDTHGHHVGDRALCEIARALSGAIRPYDACARYAGDEFVILLSSCGFSEAEQKRIELQRIVEGLMFEARPGRRVPLAISVGAAVYSTDGQTYETLLASADSRMYQDKARRRRRGFTVPLPRPSVPAAAAAALSDKELHRAAVGVL
jgi:diguanylate cyclase (GGDEF)-like protein/putative nucleotidyltransferase with HDIG domain